MLLFRRDWKSFSWSDCVALIAISVAQLFSAFPICFTISPINHHVFFLFFADGSQILFFLSSDLAETCPSRQRFWSLNDKLELSFTFSGRSSRFLFGVGLRETNSSKSESSSSEGLPIQSLLPITDVKKNVYHW